MSILRETKNYLKRIGPVYALNARFKGYLLARDLQSLGERYSAAAALRELEYEEDAVVSAVRNRLGARRSRSGRTTDRLKIFWVGANYSQDMSGFLQTLQSFGDVVIFKNERGDYGLYWPDADGPQHYTEGVVSSNSRCLYEQVAQAHRQAPLDLVIGQMWANAIDPEALRAIQALGIATANISMDDRLPHFWRRHRGRRMGSVGLGPGLDLVLTSSPECCLWYAVEGVPAVFWPMASSEKIFHPAAEKTRGVVFVGSKYGFRGEFVDGLIMAGVPVETYGPGWPSGPVDADGMAKIFSEASVILGIGSLGYNRDLSTLKQRDFDAPMAGALYLTQRNPDLLRLFREGAEIECYGGVAECVAKARRYLRDKEACMAIASAGRVRALKEHTWTNRIACALEILGLPAEQK